MTLRTKRTGQQSSYFIRKELEKLFDLPPKETATSKVAVTYKKPRISLEINHDIVVERVQNWKAIFGDCDGLKGGLSTKRSTLHLPK